MSSIRTYRDLIVWQKSMKLVEEVYRATGLFPGHELYGLSSQIRRAAVSLPSNIAEEKSASDNLYGTAREVERMLSSLIRKVTESQPRDSK